MNTKLAIEFLTQSHNDLSTFLTALGLLNNETAFTQLKTQFDELFQTFLDEYDDLKAKVTVTASQIETVEESLTLADEYYRIEEKRLQSLLVTQSALVKEIEILEEQKESIEKFSDEEKLVIEAKIDKIKQDIIDTEEEIANRRQEISNKEVLINTYNSQIHELRQQEAHHNSLAAQYDQESKVWSVVGSGKSGKKKYGWVTDQSKVVLRDQEYAKAAALDKQADDLAANISVLQKEITDAKPFIPILEQELIAHVLRLDTQKELLSLSGLDTAQKLETVKLQIQQQTEDLDQLSNEEFINQRDIVNNASEQLLDLKSQLEELQATETLAETALTDFETENAYLLTEDIIDFLDWNINEDTPETVKLWQQVLAVEGEKIVSDRLVSLQSQATSENAVEVALVEDSIESYVILEGQLATEIKTLSDIWWTNLDESNQLTLEVFNASQERSQAVDDLVSYIEENLADPEGKYGLAKIQYEEKIALQDAQVSYSDALSQSVDSVTEAVDVFEIRVEQAEILGEKIEHISKLTTYEQGYTSIQNAKAQLETLQNQDKQIADLRQEIAEIWAKEAELLGIQYQYNGKINPTTNNLYFLISNNTWTGAQAKAKELGGNLVTINNKEEQTWIHRNFGGNYWIGLTDKDQEGSWKWVSGEIISYWNFLPGQPDNANNEDFAHMNWTGDGRWNDLPNAGLHFRPIPGLVEIKANFQDLENQETQLLTQISNLQSQVEKNITNIVNSLKAETLISEQQIENLTKVLNDYQTINQNQNIAFDDLQDKLEQKNYNLLLLKNAVDYERQNTASISIVADFNGNNQIDILNYRPGSGHAFIMQSDGEGGVNKVLNTHSGIAGFDLRSGADRVVAFDYDKDGDDDLLLYRPGSGAAWIARSNGNGTFTTVHAGHGGIAGFDLRSGADKVVAFDYDGDGDDDLLLYRPGSGAAWVARSNRNGTFTPVHAGHGGIAGYDLRSGRDKIVAFDYDGDGDDDLFLYRPGSGAAWVARSNGNGTFTAVYAVGDNGYAAPNGIAGYDLLSGADRALAFDYDGDGDDDLFLYRPGTGIAWVIRSNGNGKFNAVYTSSNGIAGYDLLSGSDRVLVFDYDKDGDDDLILYRLGTNNFFVARSNGNGTFSADKIGSSREIDNFNSVNNSTFENITTSPLNSVVSQYRSVLYPKLIDKLDDEITNKTQDLIIEIDLTNDEQELWLETNLQSYIEEKQNKFQQNITNEEQIINNLQNLRVETAYLTLQAEQNPDKLKQYLEAYQASNKTEVAVSNLLKQYYPALNDANTLSNLKQQINNELTNSQTQLETLKAQISQKSANAAAALTQADWYEEQAKIHWENSRKAGPTWTEYRKAKGKSGRSKTVTIVHVDHHWIIYDTYSKQATNLRDYAAHLNSEITEDTLNQDLTTDIIAQWQQANAVADEASLTLDQLTSQLQTLEEQRKLLPYEEAQLETFKNLLPTLQEQLEIAQTAAEQAKLNTIEAKTNFDTSSQTYQTALTDVLERKTALDVETQNLLQQVANTRLWVEQQTLALDTELNETLTLRQQLQQELEELSPDNTEDITKKLQIQENIDLLIHKETILTAQQTAFTQKITLLNAQKTVIESEYDLINATIVSPDDDYSNLENQLQDAKDTLAEVQKLASQAETTSNILTAQLEDLQSFLNEQNDQYLAEIKNKQQTLQQLITATELQENYTLQATQKQNELNILENELIIRLQEASTAGSQEADYLLEVASANNFATAAEIYYRDYRDLMTDTGGGCAGGIARPDDAVKADYYYQEMLKYRALQDQAQQQADYFADIKTAAETQIDLIQQQQSVAQLEFNEIQSNIDDTKGDISDLEQELALVEIRLDALQYLRQWTEQTQLQLLQVEKLNLAQAQLEQEIGIQRQQGIDATLEAQYNRQQSELNRERAIATAKIEQLNQLQAEDALQQALNDLRIEMGLQPIEDIIQQADYKGQLAGILSDLEQYQDEQTLPDDVQTLLDETTAVIHDALQGKEAATIQDNLLNTANALIEEANQLQTEIAKLDAEEEQLLGILNQSETDLQGATKALYDEIIIRQELGEETDEINQEYLEVLYKIGYAQGAVDLSSQLAQQSKDILNQIIEGRIQERKARKKAAFNEIFGTITLVLSVASLALTAGASLAVNAATAGTSATLFGVSVATVSSIASTLSTISSALGVFQAAYNGDWATAIFRAGLMGLDGLGDLAGFSSETVIALKTSLNTAYTAYQGGDSIGVLLAAVQGIGAIALDGIDINDLSEVSDLKNLVITVSQISSVVHAGIQAIEEGDVLAAMQSLGQALGTISKNFSLGLEELAKEELESLTGLEWEQLDQIIDLGGNAYNAIENEDWISLVKSIGGVIKIVDEDFAKDAENLGKTAIEDLTGLTWDELEEVTEAAVALRVAIKTKNITDISAALNDLTNVWIDDENLNQKLVNNIGLDWQDLTHIAQTIDTLLPVIQNDNTENWVKATTELLDIWDNNISLQKQLKETTNLDWTEFKQLVAIGQTTATAIDQRSINSWINALKTTLDWALSENSFDNQKVNQIINKAQENNNTESWVNAVDDLLGVAKDATELRNKLGGITGVEWEDFKQIIEAGQAIATAIEEDKFTAWRDALTTTINIWVDDATLQKEIENQTGFKWEQLTRIGNTYEAIRKADKNGNVTAWLQATDKILILWENDSTLPDQLKTLTGLEWQDFKDFVEISQTIDTAIEQETYETWRDALKETINFWVSDQTLNQNLESLIGLNWEQIDKIGQASDALYDAYGKLEDIIKNAISSDNYKDWIKGIESVYDLWKDDPILREKVQDGGQVIWDEIESFFIAKETVENQDKKQTIQTTIEKTINETETTIKQKLENTIGLSWTQVKAIVKSGKIIAEAVQENQIDQWIEASDEILDIWEKDADLTKFLQDNYEIGWKDIKIRVETGQEIATAIDTNTIEGWAVSLNNIINIWAKDIPLTTDQQVKLEETEKLINKARNLNSPNDIQLWQEVTNQILVLWESEDDLQNYLQNKAQLSWKDLSKTVLSGQILGTQSNDIEQSISDLGEVLDIWQTDPELPHILENISDYSWQHLNDFQHDIEAKITNPILNNGDDDNLLNQFNLNEFNLVTGNHQNLGEADTITLDHNLQTITLDQTYNNPVIFAPSVSFNGYQLATPRITNVTSNSFDIYLQEPSNEDGRHTSETLSYVVFEAGTYQLSDGTLLEVGTLNTDGTTNTSDRTLTPWETIEFDIDFAQTPVIFSQVQTDNDSDLVRTRQQNATADGFEVVMEKDEIKARNGEGHLEETIGYMAISLTSDNSDQVNLQVGRTGNNVTHEWFNINFDQQFDNIPHLLANIASYDSPDPSTLRFQNLTTNGVQVTVQEDTTVDDETNHTTEIVNYLAVDGDNPLQGTAYDPLTGNRAIIGTDSNDYILGLAENDTRTGKGGHDIFVLESNQGTDTITDFELGIDQIGLTDNLTFGSLTLTDINNDTVVMFNNQELTILKGVNSTELTSDHFVGVNLSSI